LASCGTFDIHRELEEKIGVGLFGFMTRCRTYRAGPNEGVIPTIATAGNTIISDELNHDRSLDGCRLGGRQSARAYKHGDMDDLERKLREAEGTPFIITDGVVLRWEGSLAEAAADRRACRALRRRERSSTIRTAPA